MGSSKCLRFGIRTLIILLMALSLPLAFSVEDPCLPSHKTLKKDIRAIDTLSSLVGDATTWLCNTTSSTVSNSALEGIWSQWSKLADVGLALGQILEGKGVAGGVYASAAMAIASVELETTIHGHGDHSCLGFFCVAGGGINSSVGVAGTAQVSQSLGCEDNRAYVGAFLEFELSAEVPGGEIFGTYNLGLNPTRFFDLTDTAFSRDKMRIKQAMQTHLTELEQHQAERRENDFDNLGFLLSMKLLGAIQPPGYPWIDQATLARVDRQLTVNGSWTDTMKMLMQKTLTGHMTQESLGSVLKRSMQGLRSLGLSGPLGGLFDALAAEANALVTGCDSIALGGAIGLTAGLENLAEIPIGGGVKLNEFQLAGEIPMQDLIYALEMLDLSKRNHSLFMARVCQDGVNFVNRVGNVLGRLADITSNARSCYGATVHNLMGYAGRLGLTYAQMQRQYPEWMTESLRGMTRNSYQRDYVINHPHHRNCACSAEENPGHCPAAPAGGHTTTH